jgi:hypothetical protein
MAHGREFVSGGDVVGRGEEASARAGFCCAGAGASSPGQSGGTLTGAWRLFFEMTQALTVGGRTGGKEEAEEESGRAAAAAAAAAFALGRRLGTADAARLSP